MHASADRLLRRPLPFAAGGARHRVGVRSIEPANWLELEGDDVAGQLAEKARVFDAHRDEVLGALSGSQEACEELLALVRAEAAAPPSAIPSGCHPLEEAGRLVPEDFCLHLPEESSGVPMLAAGCVCFPNRWSLVDKLGRPVTAIHGPVPGYAAQLGRPVDRLMERLAEGRILERANWGVVPSGTLFAPLREGQLRPQWHPDAQSVGDDDPWLRIERQTLRRLPVSGAVVFTIRTLTAPLSVLDGDPAAAQTLAQAIRELPDDVAGYKLGPQAVRAAVLACLSAAVSVHK